MSFPTIDLKDKKVILLSGFQKQQGGNQVEDTFAIIMGYHFNPLFARQRRRARVQASPASV